LALFCDAECVIADFVVHWIQGGISTLQTVPDHLYRVLDIDPDWRVHLTDCQPNLEDKGHRIIAKVIKQEGHCFSGHRVGLRLFLMG